MKLKAQIVPWSSVVGTGINDVLPDLNKESANRLIQHIAAGTLTANIQIGVGLRLMKKIIEWQRERVA